MIIGVVIDTEAKTVSAQSKGTIVTKENADLYELVTKNLPLAVAEVYKAEKETTVFYNKVLNNDGK